MEYTLTEQLILFIATILDQNRRWSWSLFTAMSDDPRLHIYRRWAKKFIEDRRKRAKLYQALKALKRRRFVQEKIFSDGKKGFILTEKGRLKVFRLKWKKEKKRKLPNNEWIIVFFDIPEKIKKARDIFRGFLHKLGFVQIQKSVWATQFDILDEFKEIIEIYDLRKYAKYLLVKEISEIKK